MYTPQSDGSPSVYAKLFLVQSKLPTIPKTSTNPHFKSKYADLPTIMEILQPLLIEAKVLLLQPLYESPNPDQLLIGTRFVDIETGHFVETLTNMPIGANKTPQAFGSAVTYARRYALCSFLGIIADEDDDGNATQTPAKITPEQVKKLFAVATEQGYTQEDVMAKLAPKGIRKVGDTPINLYEPFLTWLTNNPKKEA